MLLPQAEAYVVEFVPPPGRIKGELKQKLMELRN